MNESGSEGCAGMARCLGAETAAVKESMVVCKYDVVYWQDDRSCFIVSRSLRFHALSHSCTCTCT